MDGLSITAAASFLVALVALALIIGAWGLAGALFLAWFDRDGEVQAWAERAPHGSLLILLVLLWPVLAATALIIRFKRWRHGRE
jgi:hypothetical protein